MNQMKHHFVSGYSVRYPGCWIGALYLRRRKLSHFYGTTGHKIVCGMHWSWCRGQWVPRLCFFKGEI